MSDSSIAHSDAGRLYLFHKSRLKMEAQMLVAQGLKMGFHGLVMVISAQGNKSRIIKAALLYSLSLCLKW